MVAITVDLEKLKIVEERKVNSLVELFSLLSEKHYRNVTVMENVGSKSDSPLDNVIIVYS